MVTRKWENVCVYCQITSISYAVTFVCPPAPCSLHPTHSIPSSFRTFPVVFGIHWFRKRIWRRRWNVQNKHRTLFSDDASGIIQNVLFIFFICVGWIVAYYWFCRHLFKVDIQYSRWDLWAHKNAGVKVQGDNNFCRKRESVDFLHAFSSTSYV